MFYLDPVTSWIVQVLIRSIGCPIAIGCNNWYFGLVSISFGSALAILALIVLLSGRHQDEDYVTVG
jgi:hypothetical protein